jgi:hypothetical protein
MPRRRKQSFRADQESESNSSKAAALTTDLESSEPDADVIKDGIEQLVLTEESPPVDEDGEEIYIVEKILDKKIVDGKPHYYLKWKGYESYVLIKILR